MLSPEERQIVEYGKSQGKSRDEVLQALTKYRTQNTPAAPAQEPAQPGFFQRVKQDIQRRGDNVLAEITNSNQNPILGGIKATGQAFGAITDVAGEAIQSTPGVKQLANAASDTISAGVSPVIDAISNTKLFREAAKYPEQTKILEDFLSGGQSLGDIANAIMVAKGTSDTLTKGAQLGSKAVTTTLDAGSAIGTNALNKINTGTKTAVPKLLSYTSDVPEGAFKSLIERRQPVTEAIKSGVTPEIALKETQSAVRGLRTSLTQEWQDASENIIKEFTGKRVGMGDQAVKLMERVADDFPLDGMPLNPKSMSVKEWMDLMKGVNELYSKPAVKASAQGIAVRKFKDFLETKVVENFGGKEGPVATLYKNYSAKKQVLDAANDIVKAYSNGKPIQQSTALGRLKALFNENKSAYLDAILQLEQATGKDLLSKITASQFVEKMPKRLSSVSASGGLNAPKGVMDKALDLLILPLSSPRSAAWITKMLVK